MNPKQYNTWMEEYWPGFIKERADDIAAALNAMAEAAKEAGKIIMEEMEALAEEMKTAAGFMETDEMIRKAHLMPEGTDKELLQHLGIRMDRYGWAYDFYYDEANKAYFMEILQEGGKRDENNGSVEDDAGSAGHGVPGSGSGNCTGDSDWIAGDSNKEHDREIGG